MVLQVTRRVATAMAVLVAAASIASALSGCSSAGSPTDSSDTIAPSTPPSGTTAPATRAFPPARSGSTDPVTGRLADSLIARVTSVPPRTSAVAVAPAPSLSAPLSTLGCAEAQRTIFWVATGWTPTALAGWVRANPAPGLTAGMDDADSLNAPVVRQVLANPGPKGSAEQLVAFRFVAMDGGRVGIAVEAEAGPTDPCKHTTGGGSD